MAGDFDALPEDCKALVMSLTSPSDACRSSLVSQMFKSVAESDAVWEQFLPPDYRIIISRYAPTLRFESKKELFLHMHHNPVLIDHGKKSFWLDRWSGKKCYILSARDLKILMGHTPQHWDWISIPEARFEQVAKLLHVCWLDVRGRINISMLSSSTLYTTFLVFKMTEKAYGFHNPAKVGVGLVGSKSSKKAVCLGITQKEWQLCEQITSKLESPQTNKIGQYPKIRSDGWYEVELGDFYNHGMDEEGELEISLLVTEGLHWKRGLILQGIEIRPKREQ